MAVLKPGEEGERKVWRVSKLPIGASRQQKEETADHVRMRGQAYNFWSWIESYDYCRKERTLSLSGSIADINVKQVTIADAWYVNGISRYR